MAEQSLGNIILRLLVDNKAFKEGLVNALELVQITSAQIKDLSQFKISAPDIKALDLALQTGEARVRDFIGAENEIPAATKPAGEGLDDSGKKHQEHSQSVQSGEQAVRRFLAENRFQDRVVGQARNSLVSMTGSFIPFIAGTGASGGATKRFSESLTAGIEQANAMEFALFGIGQVGGKLPGVIGSVVGSIGALAGPISIAVGVGALLVAFFRRSNEEAKKAAEEGLRDFDQRIQSLSRPQQIRLFSNLEQQAKDVTAQISTVVTELRTINDKEFGSLDPNRRVELLAQRDALISQKDVIEGQLKPLRDIVEAAKTIDLAHKLSSQSIEKVTLSLQKQDDLIKQLSQEIEERVDVEKRSVLTETEVVGKIELRNRLERERTQLLRTSLELSQDFVSQTETLYNLGKASDTLLVGSLEVLRQKQLAQGDVTGARETELKIQLKQQQLASEAVTVSEILYKMGRVSKENVLASYEASAKLAVLDKDRLAIEQQRQAFIDGVANKEAERQAKRKAEIDRKGAALTKSQNDLQEQAILLIQNKFDREVAAEERRHQIKLADIDDEHLDAEDKQKRIETETATTKTNSHNIEIERSKTLAQLKLDAIGNEEEREIASIRQRYEDLEGEAIKSVSNETDRIAIIAGLRERSDAEVEAYRLQKQLDSVERFASALQSAFSRSGDSFLAKLGQALQIAIQIGRALQAASAGSAGGGPLDVVSSFLGIFSLFGLAEGGELPGGSYVVNSQASKQYKSLLDLLGAGEVTGGVSGKDSVFARVQGGDGVMLMPEERVVPPMFAPLAQMINEGKLQFRADGGLVRKNPFDNVVRLATEYQRTAINPGGFPLTPNIVQDIQLRLSGGAANKEMMDALIEEVRGLRLDVSQLRGDTTNVGGKIEALHRGFENGLRTDISNGKTFMRKNIGDALDYEKDASV